jgi:hypothetical protein
MRELNGLAALKAAYKVEYQYHFQVTATNQWGTLSSSCTLTLTRCVYCVLAHVAYTLITEYLSSSFTSKNQRPARFKELAKLKKTTLSNV